MTTARIYEVNTFSAVGETAKLIDTRLVKANSQSQARTYTKRQLNAVAAIPSQEKLMEHVKNGLVPQDATGTPEVEPPKPERF